MPDWCQIETVQQEAEFHKKISSVINYITSRLVTHKCDYCGLLGRKVHRCGGCKTEVYCTRQCLDMDWEVVHRKICGKGELVRKVKWDKNKREELGKENVEDLALRMVSNPQTCLVYKKWMLETLDKMSEEDGVN